MAAGVSWRPQRHRPALHRPMRGGLMQGRMMQQDSQQLGSQPRTRPLPPMLRAYSHVPHSVGMKSSGVACRILACLQALVVERDNRHTKGYV